ncbi:MAG: TM2 domain-containing protein [Treponema sp.]|jgi:TM2 domain-containing membrane protein YozV|nr:TM2 domain-containing protein [Treponema sp.]
MYNVGVAYLLWFLSGFGALGLHRYYLGKIPTGVLWTCTFGLFGVGSIYDFFTLSGQVREANIRNAIYGNMNGRGYGRQNWRYAGDGQARVIGKKESVERIILKLAKEKGGILSAADVALEADIPLEEAKRDLDAMVSKGFAELRVRKSGTLVYTIPELMNSDDPLESL